ncbi:MAG TPA: GspH/FimT family pseudopilin [Methylomirabilota bacterium]|jgi:Tfp pilus assembly protein FimT
MTKIMAIFRRSFRRAAAGFTVVELVVLTAVISILCAIGFPLYLSYSRAQETDSAARVIVVSLNQARQLAVTRGTSFSVETQTNPNNRMRFCSGTVVPCPGGQVFTGAETDTSGWRTLENGSRITAGPNVTFSSLGAATASGVLQVQNSSASGSLDICVSPSGRIKVQAVGTACP